MRVSLLLLVMTLPVLATEPIPSVGREGAISVVLENALLQPLPVEDNRAQLILRIAGREPVANGTRYDLRWLGAVPGTYDLSKYLVDLNGRPVTGVTPIMIEVRSLLPPEYPGDILTSPLPKEHAFGGYQYLMIGIALVWLSILPFLWRRQRRRATITTVVPTLSLAEQLRTIIQQAKQTRLNTDTQARLERLLLAHWRERLHLQHVDAADALLQLRQHPEAGQLLRQLDAWLHAPPGRENVDVTALLAPYLEPSSKVTTVPR
jgi:hypothetical protein